jgi:hypothetical protein
VTPKIRVAVCGRSLHMAALAASLKAHPDVAVLRIPANEATLLQSLDELAAAVVAFDLGEMSGDFTISLLRDRPELTLIGVDPSRDRLLLLSGREEQPVSAAELVQAITAGSAGTPSLGTTSPAKLIQEASASQEDSEQGG